LNIQKSHNSNSIKLAMAYLFSKSDRSKWSETDIETILYML